MYIYICELMKYNWIVSKKQARIPKTLSSENFTKSLEQTNSFFSSCKFSRNCVNLDLLVHPCVIVFLHRIIVRCILCGIVALTWYIYSDIYTWSQCRAQCLQISPCCLVHAIYLYKKQIKCLIYIQAYYQVLGWCYFFFHAEILPIWHKTILNQS